MDRFIADDVSCSTHKFKDLKSSMDRFIVDCVPFLKCCQPYLKSSMDRFIACIKEYCQPRSEI